MAMGLPPLMVYAVAFCLVAIGVAANYEPYTHKSPPPPPSTSPPPPPYLYKSQPSPSPPPSYDYKSPQPQHSSREPTTLVDAENLEKGSDGDDAACPSLELESSVPPSAPQLLCFPPSSFLKVVFPKNLSASSVHSF
ncbi:hypothetical protein SAY86_008998 [Trapa natans]|uniref:Extensin n=1 Tax=Trapa natans TaxID=22666 RepID=A0AAN7K9M1_TRANT|nr:hypothetical protein SAY86_008998 [Trapa natans]